MEMIDVLKKLEDIASNSPEVAKAIESTEAMNPKEVDENAVESDKSLSQNDQEVSEEVKDKINEFKVGSYKDFLASKGIDIFKLKGDEHSKYAKMYRDAKATAHQDATAHKGPEDHKTYTPSTANSPAKIEDETNEGGMSDIHIGAQEAIGDWVDEDGNLTAPKRDVVAALVKKSKEVPFPTSYEYETAARMVADDFDDDGSPKADMEPNPDDIPHDVDTQMNMDAPAEEPKVEEDITPIGTREFLNMGAKVEINFDQEQSMMIQGVLNRLDQDALLKAVETYKAQELDPDQAESKELNSTIMKTEDKKPVNEAIEIKTDSPEEAGVMMQILKLAGVQQVTPDMMGADDQEANPEHGEEGHVCGGCDDAEAKPEMGMDQMRDMVQRSQEEPTEETFANEPDEKHQDTEYMLNKMAGGMNRKKQAFARSEPGDNPMAAEDKVTEEDLANSLRSQYEGFKKEYQEAAKVAEAKPDFLDMDKDGNKKEPMKKAIKDKDAK